MSATDTLAPCPFCDGMAMLDESEDGFWAAVCADCVATTEYETATEAATAWNRRAPAQPSQEAMEQARDIAKIVDEDVYGDLPDGAELRDLLAQSVYARALAALTATHAKADEKFRAHVDAVQKWLGEVCETLSLPADETPDVTTACASILKRLEDDRQIAHDQQGAIATANEQIASLARSLELASEEQDRLLILAKRTEGLPADMTPSIQEALGAMIFQTGPIAHLFKAAGYAIPHKIEMEQAFVLWRMLNCAIAHGEKWREAFGKELDAALETACAKETK